MGRHSIVTSDHRNSGSAGGPGSVAKMVLVGSHPIGFIGRGNVWVEDSVTTRDSVHFVQFLLLQALALTTPGQLEILVFDHALTGIAAPFQDVNDGGVKVLDFINDERELLDRFRYMRNHIHGVYNVIQGRADSLLEFREQLGTKVESFKLVVLAADYELLSGEVKNQLAMLATAGPNAGVTFLVHSIAVGTQPAVFKPYQRYTVTGNVVGDAEWKPIDRYQVASAQHLIKVSRRTARQLATAEVDPVAFSTVQDLSAPWSGSSRDGITFAVGTYGLSTVEITLGDDLNQRHNMLITGAVGQGKSNLISVVVHSLCQRYSPSEVEFYMLDFKEGVTLQAFAPQSGGEFLPHARVLGLDADREYGLNVLRHLFAVYKQRMAIFKASGVQNIRQYRLANPEAVMPRIVVVIDEFQMLLADQDDIASAAADRLIKAARLFRACGIHLVLASQTIGGNMSLAGSIGDGLFGQIPVRLALKNSLSESHATLGLSNDAASHLQAREAIVNLDYGDVSANRKTTIAYADESVLAPLRRQWWLKAGSNVAPPEVFEGERRRSLDDDTRFLDQLQSGQALLGTRVTVGSTPLAVSLSADIGRNLALLGTGPGHTVLLSALLSLTRIRSDAEVIILDLADDWPRHPIRQVFDQQVVQLGAPYRLVDKHSVDELMEELTNRTNQPTTDADSRPTYVVGFGMERWRIGSGEHNGLFKAAPLSGIHFLLWWKKHSSFKDHVSYDGAAYWDIKAAMHLDDSSARDLFDDPLLRWTSADNRMLAWDSAEMSQPQLVIPYTILPTTH